MARRFSCSMRISSTRFPIFSIIWLKLSLRTAISPSLFSSARTAKSPLAASRVTLQSLWIGSVIPCMTFWLKR